ncbi:transcriptional protein SWT1 isoform X1 [Frieseomelitta varia]|uniref:transcriptional protein SWT1 isoform X1 n=2 Tax=Frieseomelitta varia TaxID=561572 RepID=UPI001CB69503|nr:transcriptional protein SWT1 isoform X1 [Frieseomelitta varia]
MMKCNLPKNWVVRSSKSRPDRIYYFNVKTNQSSWEMPTNGRTEQVEKKLVQSPKKHKQSYNMKSQKDNDNQVKSIASEHTVSGKETSEREILVAKCKQMQNKVNEGKETPQMKAIREKILKRKEEIALKVSKSPKSTKDVSRSSSSTLNKTNPLVQKANSHTDSRKSCTPQMQILLEKMQERIPKSPIIKKTEEDRSNNQGKSIKTRLRNQTVSKQKAVSSGNTSQKEVQKSPKEKNFAGKRKNEHDPVEVILGVRKQKSMKKNLAKDRMERLRENLKIICDDDNLNNNIFTNDTPMPCIYKNAEVRLVRLKERLANNKISTNKNVCTDKLEETTKVLTDPVTTVDDLIKRANDDSLYEEMDWEPLEDEKITFEVQAVRTRLCTENNMNISCNVPSTSLKYPLLSEQQEKKHLYIVVDTNVFLSNIDAVELARETIFKTYDHSIILVPWTVIRELDYIKDDNGKSKSKSLCYKARKAINYINKLFSSKKSYIIGQTPEDVTKNKEKFSVDCPDDEILQACLQIRDLGKSAVLLSYDVNLCNKAMIHDIVTLGRNDPIEKIDYLNATNMNQSLSVSNDEDQERFSLSSTILSEELQLSNEIYEDIKSVIRDFLTVIVSKEMGALYGASWEKYVILKPPWTVETVLQCAVKHWIAAVSESFRREAEVILKELLQIFKDRSDQKTLKEDSYILDKCNDLVQMVNIDKYKDLVLRISQKINELKDKCRGYECQINDYKLCNAIGVENNIEGQEHRAQKAFQYFEAAYIFARDMAGMAAEAMGMPCSFHYNIPNPIPNMCFVKQIQPELATNVNQLLCSLSAVIEQVRNSNVDYRTLINLHQILITFLPETAPMTLKLIDIDIEPLDVYCCVKRKEDVLNRGLRQLQELNTHFCRLASCQCT